MENDASSNGYILFCEWARPHLRPTSFEESGRLLGQEWKRQTENQKSWWKRIASRDPSQFNGKMNPYMLFCAVVRDDLNRGKKLSIGEQGHQLGEYWRSLKPEEQAFWDGQTRKIWG